MLDALNDLATVYFRRLSAEVDSAGIEGILSRLEKERNITFGVGLRINGSHGNVPYHGVDDRLSQDSVDLVGSIWHFSIIPFNSHWLSVWLVIVYYFQFFILITSSPVWRSYLFIFFISGR